MASPLAVGDRVRIEKGYKNPAGQTVAKGTHADVVEIQPLGAEYSHQVKVRLKFVNGFNSGRTMNFYTRHMNRLSDDVVHMNDGRPEHRIEVIRQAKPRPRTEVPSIVVGEQSEHQLPERGDSAQAIHRNLERHGYSARDVDALDVEARRVAQEAHDDLVEPESSLLWRYLGADAAVALAKKMGRHQKPDWNPDRPLSIRESAALEYLTRAYLADLHQAEVTMRTRGGKHPYFRSGAENQTSVDQRVRAQIRNGVAPNGADLVEASPEVAHEARRFLEARGAQHDCYGPEHKMGAIVPKGGSMCGNCAFGHSDDDGPHCLNTCWSGTPAEKGGGGGETHLPVMDATTYCCDLWTPKKKP